MSLKAVAARVVAVLLGLCFCFFGAGVSTVGLRLAISGGNLVGGTVVGVFGLPFLGIGLFSGYKGITGRVKWAEGSTDIETGVGYGPGFGGE